MQTDEKFKTVYLADTLGGKHPKLLADLRRAMSEHKVEHHFIKGTADIWCRDYMPVVVNKDQAVKFDYDPSYLKPKQFQKLRTTDEVLTKNPIPVKVIKSPINIDGGNVVPMGDKVILTDRIFRENPTWGRNNLLNEISTLLQSELVIIPAEPWDPVGHADGILRGIGTDRVVKNNFRKINPDYEQALVKVLHYEGIDFEELPTFTVDKDNIWDATGNYVNYLRVGDVVFMPAFNTSNDAKAAAKLQKCMPSCTIVPINAQTVAKTGGLLNCVSWCA